MTPNGEDMNLLQLMPLLKHRPWLVEQLARLGPAAARQKDPELYAALFLEELPEDVPADVLGGLLSREDWFVLLAEVDPRINSAELYPWFEVLRGYLLQSLRAESGAPGGGIAPQPTPAVAAPVSNPVPSTRTPSHGEIDRPTRLPSLTGEIE